MRLQFYEIKNGPNTKISVVIDPNTKSCYKNKIKHLWPSQTEKSNKIFFKKINSDIQSL